MRSVAATLALALACIAPLLHAETLTTWRIPYKDASPAQIAASAADMFFVDGVGGIGRVSTGTGLFRFWKLPFFSGSPGGIQYQPTDGTVFVTSTADCALGQFDAGAQTFRKWFLPVCPRDFTTDAQGRLVFTSHAPDVSAFLIGRLDSSANTVETWQVPDSMITVGEDFPFAISVSSSSVFFGVNGFRHRTVVLLTPATGEFQAWNVGAQPIYGKAADPEGNLFFQEVDSGVRRIARLSPGTGKLTEWDFAGDFDGDLIFNTGRAFFTQFDPTASLVALDPAAVGTDSYLSSFSSPSPAINVSVISPTVTQHHVFRAGYAPSTVEQVSPSTSGAFTSWPIDRAGSMATNGEGAVFFTTTMPNGAPAIARLAP